MDVPESREDLLETFLALVRARGAERMVETQVVETGADMARSGPFGREVDLMAVGSVTARNLLLNVTLGPDQDVRIPNPLYLALSNGDMATSGTEPAPGIGGYARQPLSKDAWEQFAANGIKKTVQSVTFGPSSAAWTPANVTWAALYDAQSGGILWDTVQLTTAVSVSGPGYTISFPSGAIIMTHQ